MQISKEEMQAMTIKEKQELLDIIWESLEKGNYSKCCVLETTER